MRSHTAAVQTPAQKADSAGEKTLAAPGTRTRVSIAPGFQTNALTTELFSSLVFRRSSRKAALPITNASTMKKKGCMGLTAQVMKLAHPVADARLAAGRLVWPEKRVHRLDLWTDLHCINFYQFL